MENNDELAKLRAELAEATEKLKAYEGTNYAKAVDRIAALEKAGNAIVKLLPVYEVELAREIWGNTNTNIVKSALAAWRAVVGE